MTSTRTHWDVVTSHTDGRAYGESFDNETTATAYAEAMRAHGYDADLIEIEHAPDIGAALTYAANFYADRVLGQTAYHTRKTAPPESQRDESPRPSGGANAIDPHHQKEAAADGRKAEQEGRPVMYIHGRAFTDPAHATDEDADQ